MIKSSPRRYLQASLRPPDDTQLDEELIEFYYYSYSERGGAEAGLIDWLCWCLITMAGGLYLYLGLESYLDTNLLQNLEWKKTS